MRTDNPLLPRISVIALVVFLVCTGAFLSAQSDLTRREPMAESSSQLNLLGFTIGKHTLADVQAKLGPSTPKKCSGNEEAPREICYTSNSLDHTKVIFRAGFSGGWTELDGYKIISGNLTPQCFRQCSSTVSLPRIIKTDSGLRLGLTRQQVEQILGKPIRSSSSRLRFRRKSRQAMTKEEADKQSSVFSVPTKDPYWEVLDTIDIVLAQGRAIEIDVYRTISY